jgi:site-specific DNA-methyltransferase (adenine-specific)
LSVIYEDEFVTLHHADYRDGIDLVDGAHAVITDPPYGETSLAWDRWPTGWLDDAAKITSALWCFGSFRMFHENADEFRAWKFSQDIVWRKNAGTGFASDRFKRVHEYATLWYRGDWADIHHEALLEPSGQPLKGRTINRGPTEHYGKQGQVGWVDEGTRLVQSVIDVRNMHGSAVHPTQKPVGIVSPLIEYSVPRGGLVVDLFAGSGTTAVAARQLGRRCIAYEANERYAEAAARRLSQQSFIFEETS